MAPIEPTAPDKLMTPANIVTLIRICLVPVFVLAIVSPWPLWMGLPDITTEAKRLIAAGIFILISCTDWLDGYLARSRGEVTDFGKFMDPLADKILVAAALIALVELAVLPGWPVLIILAREFIVSGIRMVAASKGKLVRQGQDRLPDDRHRAVPGQGRPRLPLGGRRLLQPAVPAVLDRHGHRPCADHHVHARLPREGAPPAEEKHSQGRQRSRGRDGGAPHRGGRLAAGHRCRGPDRRGAGR
jgi:CDP-diacylglycerol--glycerol-3-phosphate 3-phosphatidyltransferase